MPLVQKVYAVILAAGTSSRLGFNKLTVVIDGESVIRRSVKPFFIEGIDKVLVVTGHSRADVEREMEGWPVYSIHNPHFRAGMSASIKATIPYVDDAKAIIFHLGDKPFATKESVTRLLVVYRERRPAIVVPLWRGKTGHPVLIDAALLRAEIGMIQGDRGLRELIEKYWGDVVFIEGDEGNVFDLDTLHAIQKLRERGYRVEKSEC